MPCISRSASPSFRLLQVGVFLAGLLCVAFLRAETPATKKKSFEIISIKPNNSETGNTRVGMQNGRLIAENFSVLNLIQMAFDLHSDKQLVGLPDSLGQLHFDIEAKPDDETRAGIDSMKREDSRKVYYELLQSLLVDRFHLQFHHEEKEFPGFALVVAKGGLKITPDPPLPEETKGGSRVLTKRGEIDVQRIQIDFLAKFLPTQEEIGERPVADKTGLTGQYSFTLKWVPEKAANAAASSGEQVQGPTLFTALQEQLGLKLEPQKVSVDVVVIDHIEKPTEN